MGTNTKAVETIINIFSSGNVPAAIAQSVYSIPSSIPMAKWSISNRTIALLSGTCDARGYNQWKQVGRQVKYGTKAIWIWAPIVVKKTKQAKKESWTQDIAQAQEPVEVQEAQEARETTQEVAENVCIGYRPIPVFKFEDTEGAPIEYAKPNLPDIPLISVAHSLGITVDTTISADGVTMGLYLPSSNKILLATSEQRTFFHELAHAAHNHILRKNGKTLHNIDSNEREIIAELAAAAIGYLVQTQIPTTIGNTWEYIKYFAGGENAAIRACLKLCNTIGEIVEYIITIARQQQVAKAA